MFASTQSPTRRKPGADEDPYPTADFRDPNDSPFIRRRKLLRWVRSRKDISANLYKVIESVLDRILATSSSLIGWDSVGEMARRTGLCVRSVNLALAELKKLGLGIRLRGRDSGVGSTHSATIMASPTRPIAARGDGSRSSFSTCPRRSPTAQDLARLETPRTAQDLAPRSRKIMQAQPRKILRFPFL